MINATLEIIIASALMESSLKNTLLLLLLLVPPTPLLTPSAAQLEGISTMIKKQTSLNDLVIGLMLDGLLL